MNVHRYLVPQLKIVMVVQMEMEMVGQILIRLTQYHQLGQQMLILPNRLSGEIVMETVLEMNQMELMLIYVQTYLD